MPARSENDPESAGRSGPPVRVIVLVALAVLAVVVLHLTGVIGPA